MQVILSLKLTHRFGQFKLSHGHYFPYGTLTRANAISFSIHSSRATSCTLVLFKKGAQEPFVEIPVVPAEFRIGDVFSIAVFDIDPEDLEYGYRLDGPSTQLGDRFDSTIILMDPYAKVSGGREKWGVAPSESEIYHHRSRLLLEDFDWERALPLQRAIHNLIIISSWHCGIERATDDPAILSLPKRQMKNAMSIPLLSRGVPMIYSGDEVGHTQHGNNNNYCHDNELSWLDWGLLEKNADLLRFFKYIIASRHAHPVLRSPHHFRNEDCLGTGYPDISWHGDEAWNVDWAHHSHTLAFLISGAQLHADHPEQDAAHSTNAPDRDDFIYAALNMHWEPHDFELLRLPKSANWYLSTNTGLDPLGGHCAAG